MLLYLLSLLAVEWDVKSAAELAVAIVGGLVVSLGGIVAIAWSVSQRGRAEWFKMAEELVSSDRFAKAVHQANESFAQSLTFQMRRDIGEQIEKHDQDVKSNRPAINHRVVGALQAVELTHGRNIVLLEARATVIERRLDALEKKGA